MHTDGGGVVRGALRPIAGAAKVARLMVGIGPQFAGVEYRWTVQGGAPVALLLAGGVPRAAVGFETDADGRVTALYTHLNPAKLRHAARTGGPPWSLPA